MVTYSVNLTWFSSENVHIYLSGTILNGSFLQKIGDAEHIISPVCRF